MTKLAKYIISYISYIALQLGTIFKKQQASYHLYADDRQLYVSLKPHDSVQPLIDSLSDKIWLSTDLLLLNDAKTEVILFSTKYSLAPQFHLSSFHTLKSSISILGVRMDSLLKMEAHINQIVMSSFFHLRRLAKLKPILKRRAFTTEILSFTILLRS